MAFPFKFTVQHQLTSGLARAGCIETAHGKILTPAFMPVATHAVVRGQHTETLARLGFPVLLANTYHLLLRPGPEVFQKFGGIHRYMGWGGAVLTDSGGYQIFSLSRYLKMSEAGAEFRSYIDGKKIMLTPEVSIATQQAINSDIMMVLDHCLPSGAPPAEIEAALELTQRWAERSLEARGVSQQALFAIVQGGTIAELRARSAAQLTALPFDGFAIGGLAVGEATETRDEIVRLTSQLLPPEKPRYLMGVGTPLDLLEAVGAGMDMFDCILPTAMAQQGTCYSARGKVDLSRGTYRLADGPIDPECPCSTCASYSRSYLHHLNRTGEFHAGTLMGIHNLTFYKILMEQLRQAILGDRFETFYHQMKTDLSRSDEGHPIVIQPRRRTRKKHLLEWGDYQITRRGEHVSIAQRSSGEVMHSVCAPLVEAERLYIAQSGLRERVCGPQVDGHPLTLWDVGLGAATNAMSAVLAYEQLAKDGSHLVPLRIVSFENDLDSLHLAVHNLTIFQHLRHEAAHKILHTGSWESKVCDLRWSLCRGDFAQELRNAPAPHIIFYDPFSYKVNEKLWTLEIFSEILQRSLDGQTELFTYSASTSVRAALLAAGFFVARGIRTGPKAETTIALCGPPQNGRRHDLLGREWLERWERSDKQLPLDVTDQACEITHRIRSHPQFQNKSENFLLPNS